MATSLDRSDRNPSGARWAHARGWPGRGLGWFVETWPVRGFREAEAGNLVAIIAFNALVALVPSVLLLVAIAGLLLRRDDALTLVARSAYWALPAADTRDALDAALAARRHSGLLGLVSLAGFLWVGTGFINSLSHCLNRVYGVADHGFVRARRRGFVVVVVFSVLSAAAVLAATLPTLFVGGTGNNYFRTWALAAGWAQALGYLLAYAAAALLFLMLYRTLPNAGQRLKDVWPGALLAGALFVVLGQAFPLYLRLAGGANRYGAALGLVTLLVTWFGALAHVVLFGCYVNVTHRRRRLGPKSGGEAAPPHGEATARESDG